MPCTLQKFSKVSSLLNLQYKTAIWSSFKDIYLEESVLDRNSQDSARCWIFHVKSLCSWLLRNSTERKALHAEKKISKVSLVLNSPCELAMELTFEKIYLEESVAYLSTCVSRPPMPQIHLAEILQSQPILKLVFKMDTGLTFEIFYPAGTAVTSRRSRPIIKCSDLKVCVCVSVCVYVLYVHA